jgi:hypothetical protein
MWAAIGALSPFIAQLFLGVMKMFKASKEKQRRFMQNVMNAAKSSVVTKLKEDERWLKSDQGEWQGYEKPKENIK